MGESYSPKNMLDDYKDMRVQADGVARVAVNKYRNHHNSADKGGTQNAIPIKDALLQAGVSANVIRAAGGAQAYMDVFTGKGSAGAIAAVLGQFYNYHQQFIAKFGRLPASNPQRQCADYLDNPNLSWQDTLQAISNAFIGLDCNGFVGNWLRMVAPEFKLGPNTSPRDIYYARESARTTVAEIEYWDVIVWADFSHIAAIETPVDLGPGTPRTFNVCQSAGGGPRMNNYSITPASSGKFRLSKAIPPSNGDVAGEVFVVTHWQ